MRLKLWLILLPGLCLFACKEKQKSSSAEGEIGAADTARREKVEDTTMTYFSIRQYFEDQWKTREGNPYVLVRIRKVNGRADSANVPLNTALWDSLTAPFNAADISDKKFLGYYHFDMFDDEITNTRHYHYEALSEGLFLRKMDIATDVLNDKVQSVYLETRKKERGTVTSQKLYYAPDRIFQIQEFKKGEDVPESNMLLEYRY